MTSRVKPEDDAFRGVIPDLIGNPCLPPSGLRQAAFLSWVRQTPHATEIALFKVHAVTHQWADFCTRRVKAVLDGSWKSGSAWGGIKEGMVRVGDFGPRVPKKVQDEVLELQKAVGSGKLVPFAGPITDNEGREVLAKGLRLTDEQFLNMNDLVQGVVGKVGRGRVGR